MAKWRGAGSAADLLGLTLSDACVHAVAGNLARARRAGRAAGATRSRPARTTAASSTRARRRCSRRCARVYGDEPSTRALGRYARRFRFEHPGPEDFSRSSRRCSAAHAADAAHGALRQGLGRLRRRRRVAEGRRAPRGSSTATASARRSTATSAPEAGTTRSSCGGAGRCRSRSTSSSCSPTARRDASTGTARGSRGASRGAARRAAGRGGRPGRPRADRREPREQPRLGRGEAAGERRRTLERATYWMQLALQAVSP